MIQNRVRLARCYLAMGRLADGRKEALKVLEQAPDNGDAIITLTEAARSKEDIEAAEKQLQKFPNKNDVSFYLAVANLSFSGGDLSTAGNALRAGAHRQSQIVCRTHGYGKFASGAERPQTSRRRI